MRKTTNHFLIGIFVIAGALLIVLGVILLGTSGLHKTLLVETCFAESVQGLEVGSPMRLRGVKIGEVHEITFANRIYRTQHTYALVRVAIAIGPLGADDVAKARKSIEELITQGMRVRLAPHGITGTLYLESEMPNAERFPQLEIDWHPGLPYVPSAPSLLGRVTSSVDAVLERLARTDFDGLIAQARDLLGGLSTATDNLRASELRADLAETLRSARDLMEPLRDRLPRTVGNLDATLQEVHDFASDARGAADSFQTTLARADRALRGLEHAALGGARDLEASLGNLRVATEELRALSAGLRNQPSLLLFGQPAKPILEHR